MDGSYDYSSREVREGVEPPCIGFAGPRITVLPPHRFIKHDLNNLSSCYDLGSFGSCVTYYLTLPIDYWPIWTIFISYTISDLT